MKKKLIAAIFAAACAVTCAFGFAACGSGGDDGSSSVKVPDAGHQHVYSREWQKDEKCHWHECTVKGCEAVDEYVPHDFSEGDCVCGQPAPHTHEWKEGWEKNGTHHWHECSVDGCTGKVGYAEHDFTNGDCVCGQPAPHTHKWQETWLKDETHHWHECKTCEEKGSYGEHVYVGGVCVCGKVAEHTHQWKTEWESNANYHWHVCSFDGCTVRNGTAGHDFSEGDCVCGKPLITFESDGDGCKVSRIETTSKTEIIIPEQVDGKPVTAIGDGAFNGCGSIVGISLPDSITAIGRRAFRNCKSLTTVNIPDGVKRIEDGAFLGCAALTGITLPDGLTYIGGYAFQSSGLTNISIPDSVTYIGDYAFSACDSLQYNEYDNGLYLGNERNPYIMLVDAKNTEITECTIYEDTKFFGSGVFYDCVNLTSVKIPTGITRIGASAFNNCSSLESLTIPHRVTEIGNYAFEGCAALSSVNIPDGVKAIGESTFEGCKALTEITLPESVKVLGNYAFAESGLTNLNQMQGVERIGDNAFWKCAGLTEVNIPQSVKIIGYGAFSGCGKNITVSDGIEFVGNYAFNIDEYGASENPTYARYENGYYIGDENNPYAILVKADDSVSASTFTVHADTKVICSNAFRTVTGGDTGLTKIVIPDGIRSIGRDAFENCDNLQYNEYDNGLYLGNDSNPYVVLVKAKKTSITSCVIHRDTKIIAHDALEHCKITEIVIPEGVRNIGFEAFMGCDRLKSVVIPDSVISIDERVFYGCMNLSEVTAGSGVAVVGTESFTTSSLTVDFTFKGTKDEWQNVIKGNRWNGYVMLGQIYYKFTTVHCSDGDVAVD